MSLRKFVLVSLFFFLIASLPEAARLSSHAGARVNACAVTNDTETIPAFATVTELRVTGGPIPNDCLPPVVKTSFAATDTVVFLWANATDTVAGDVVKWEFVQPNGAIYAQPQITLTFSGNVCFWNGINIAGQPAATLPGNWQARLIYNGALAGATNFTIGSSGGGVTLNDHKMTGSEPANDCSAPTTKTSFATTDARAYQWTFVSGTSAGDVVRWDYIQPNGSVYGSDQLTLTGGGLRCFWTWIDIAGQPAAALPGNWQTLVFYNGALLTSDNFTIGSAQAGCPTVSNINPTSGAIGSSVTLTGTNFTGVTSVRFANNATSQFTVNNNTQITATVPGGAITGPITIGKPNCTDVQTSIFTVSTSPGGCAVRGDYQFQNTLGSSAGTPPALTNLGANTFGTATVDGASRTVLRFAAQDGLMLLPTMGVVSNSVYSVAMLFSFSEISGYRRILDFKNNVQDTGLYNLGGNLVFFGASAGGTGTPIAANTFVQVVLTRDAARNVTGYVNGVLQFTFVDSGDLALIDANNRLIFFRDNANQESSAGSMARIRLYDCALSANEVAGLGRLPDGQPVECPTVNSINPVSGPVGSTVTINGANVTGVNSVRFANNVAATFTINSASQITATIPNGAITGTIILSKPNCPDVQTSVFTVTPTTTNRTVRVVGASGSPGGNVAVPIELIAQGDENALGFSLTFPPGVLSNPQAALGVGATSATLTPNLSQTAQGRLGIVLALPSGQTFAAGTRQIVVVTFTVAANTLATTATISFGGQPTAQEISNVNAQVLSANFTPGTVTITTGFEADVAPRPTGNGSVSVTDWVQVGRFAAGVDVPAPGSEFQRADCAPRESLGNGSMTVSDWVQAGRYAAGLDNAPIAAGGPTSQLRNADFELRNEEITSAIPNQARVIRVVSSILERGRSGAIVIELVAQGNENALGFSLTFNPAQLSFVSSAVGSGATGAMINTNPNQAANGRVGIVMALPAGQTLAAGTRQILVVTFNVSTSDSSTTATIGFGDQPITREVADANAATLTAGYTGATLTIARSVASVSAASYDGSKLASEAIVAAFGQELATTTEIAATIPLPTSLAGTTVKIKDVNGVERLAPLFFVSPGQINYQLPPGTAAGSASVAITGGSGSLSLGTINVVTAAPGLFTANASGLGLAAAVALRVRADGSLSYEPITRFDSAQNQIVAVPIDLGPATDQVFLLLFGTGWRFRSSLTSVNVIVGGSNSEISYAGPQGDFVGLDQINARLPRTLIGRGEVNIELTVDGTSANTVRVNIK